MPPKLASLAGLFCLLMLNACVSPKSARTAISTTPATTVPQASREFRAAWVATVGNINWPSKPGLTSEQQQAEAIVLLDYLKEHHFNAVVFQVRPQADALYKSDIEPWSYWLTGLQGKEPTPFYDPLEFWVKAAHDRGLELHVWLNPYRAYAKGGGEISDLSIVKKHPELVLFLKQGYWWMDPGRKEVQDYTASVVRDLVKRYDIDGVHMDDYFYPYLEYNNGEDFPDSASWSAYQNNGGKLSRADWRRDNVNTLIERLYKETKAAKKYVKFGISPFGTWRPGSPSIVEGFSQYDKLYADAKLWLNKGWLDYFSPQLYWPISRLPLSFPVLLGWWRDENTMQRHLWPGINVGRDTGYKSVNETISQIMIERGMNPQSSGVVHWSISSDMRNTVLSQALMDGPYKKNALVPASPWLDNKAPAAPTAHKEIKDSSINISWSHADEATIFRWVVYYKYGNNWNYTIMNRNDRNLSLPLLSADKTPAKLSAVAVSAVGRTGNESERAELSGW
ncbi:MAG TPA: family 10 glycosylhydrolase [Chitinophagaceae bacterium]|jgi:uncharacterized lipoprotein YddW (UPF0748 family)